MTLEECFTNSILEAQYFHRLWMDGVLLSPEDYSINPDYGFYLKSFASYLTLKQEYLAKESASGPPQ